MGESSGMPEPSQHARRFDGDLTPLLVLGLVLVVTLSIFFVTDTLAHRRQALDQASAEERQRALFFAGHIDSLVLLADHMVADISAEAGERLEGALSEATPLSPGLVDGRIIRQVLVFKADGTLWASYPSAADPQPSLDCRACRSFQALQTRESMLGAFFADVPHAVGPIGLARRISKPDGSFGGMVVALFDLGAVVQQFGSDALSVVLFTPEDGIVARYSSSDSAPQGRLPPPDFPPLSAFSLAQGSASDLLTGEVAAAVQRLDAAPLWVGVANGLQRINRQTTNDFLVAIALTVGTIIAVGTFCAVAGGQIRRRRRAERSLTSALGELERRVNERTSDLRREIEERKVVEAALRESEGRFQHFMENTPTGAHITDEDGRFIFVNRRLAEWLDIEPAAAVGKTGWDLLPEELAAQWEEHDCAAIAEDRLETRELVFRLGQGQRVWLAEKFRLSIDAKTRLLGGLITDITAQRSAEQELHHAQRMEALGQLASGVTHDLNNLLTIILGNLEIVEDLAEADGDIRLHAREAQWAARRGAHLTDRLLAMSQRRPPQAGLADVALVVNSMSELLARTLGKEITTVIVTPSQPVMAMLDVNRLENAILNLCLNARDAMPRGGTLRIEVGQRQSEEPPLPEACGAGVVVSVTDTGIGMPPDVIERACDPFFTTKGPGKGTGLGLSMVRNFLDEMKGQLRIDSQSGIGTRISMGFPRAEAALLPTSPASDPAEATAAATVLVVEDEPEIRRLAVDILGRLDYQVHSAEDARAALAILDSTAIDILVSDIIMPGGMNGVELAREVRRRWPQIRILLTSGYPSDALDEQATEAAQQEAFVLLRKPYDRQGLARAVAGVAEAHEVEIVAAKI